MVSYIYLDIMANVSFPWEKIVSYIKIWFSGDEYDSRKIVRGEDIKWSLTPQYPACQIIDLVQYFDISSKNVPEIIYIRYDKIYNLRLTLNIEDKRKSLSKRTLKSNYMNYEGTPIVVEDLLSPKMKSFYLTISQTIDLETDQGKNCINYPTEEFENFQECDETFVYDEMKNIYKFMPFWAARTSDEITKFG